MGRGPTPGAGGVSSVRSVFQKQSDLDTVETARVGAGCSRCSNQCSQGESPWRHRRSHQAMTLSLHPSSLQLEPGEHCTCTRHDLWVLSHSTLCSLGLRETEAVWQGQPTPSPTYLVGSAAGSEAAGELGCTLCMVTASFSLAPLGLQPLCQGSQQGGRAEVVPVCAHATRNWVQAHQNPSMED